MAIEISPEAIQQKKALREFASPVSGFLAATGVFCATMAVAWVLSWAWTVRVHQNIAKLDQERQELQAKRDSEVVSEIRKAAATLDTLSGALDAHKDGALVFPALESLLQKSSRANSFSVDTNTGAIKLDIESRDYIEAARQIATFEEDSQARVLSIVAKGFKKERTENAPIPPISYTVDLTLSQKVFLVKEHLDNK